MIHRPDLGLIAVTGDKALDFLQGQATCDMRQLKEDRPVAGAFCNAQGRVMALFHAILVSSKMIILITQRDLIDDLIIFLGKKALFSKVHLTIIDDYQLASFISENNVLNNFSNNALNTTFCYHQSESSYFYMMIFPLKIENDAARGSFDRLRMTGALRMTLRVAEIKAFYPQVYKSTMGLFLPQELNLDRPLQSPQSPLSANSKENIFQPISWDKGCYCGQEIIARLHYLGKQKKQLTVREFSLHELSNPLISNLKPGDLTEEGDIVVSIENQKDQENPVALLVTKKA